MRYIGLDVHQRQTRVALLDVETGEVSSRSVPTAELPTHLSGLAAELRIVLEAGGNSGFVARELLSCGWEVVVVHPPEARRQLGSRGRAKTDRCDAEGLVQALARGNLDDAVIWLPGPWIADLRELTRTREQLVRHGTRLRVQLRQALVRWGETCPYQNLTGKRATVCLDELEARLRPAPRCVLQSLRRALAGVAAEIDALSAVIEAYVRDHPDVQRLCTLVGVGVQSAAVIVAEIGDIGRFATAAQLRSYSGLVPEVRQSGERRFTGPLTKAGNPHLRRTMVLVAQHFAQSQATRELPMRRWHARLVYKHGPNPAKVALARRLLDIIFAMLRDQTSFDAERYELAA
jgi:transposase